MVEDGFMHAPTTCAARYWAAHRGLGTPDIGYKILTKSMNKVEPQGETKAYPIQVET